MEKMKNEDIINLEAIQKTQSKVRNEVKALISEINGGLETHVNFTDDFLQPMDLALINNETEERYSV
jgi:hypothetical protein